MPEQDENQQAVRNVDKATDSKPVRGEDLLESDEAKHLLREAKERIPIKPRTRPRGLS